MGLCMSLIGALVQRAHRDPSAVVLELRVPGQTYMLALTAGALSAPRLGISASAEAKTAWRSGLPRDKALEGMNVVAVGKHGLTLVARELGRYRHLVARLHAVVLLKDEQCQLGEPLSMQAMLEAGEQSHQGLVASALRSAQAEATSLLAATELKARRRAERVREDLARIERTKSAAAMGPWLISEAKKLPRGAKEIVGTDWSTGEARELRVALDPAKPALAQVLALFDKAKRMARGQLIAEGRLEAVEQARRATSAALEMVQLAESAAEIDELMTEWRGSVPNELRGKPSRGPAGAKSEQQKALPYRLFRGTGEQLLLVGKGASQNDELTTKVARPADWWFHAKDRTGAHVIAPTHRGDPLHSEVLVDAAHLAAHFSDSRGELIVDVQYTQKRHLRKPKGAAPGFVVVGDERVLVLRLEPERLARLLASEDTELVGRSP